jgi:hypothetical protein
MQMSGINCTLQKRMMLALVVAGLVLLQSCGSSNSSYVPSTTLNPAPGVTLTQIKITPSTPIILLGQARQLFATGIYSDGSSIDISSSVTWSAASTSGATNVSVGSKGAATASSIGQSVITATVGSVVGVLGLTVASNGFSSTTMAILSVPFKSTEIDVGYLPQQTKIGGLNYAVQVVNLDADQFASQLPVPLALRASIPMPAGFVPNAAAASLSSVLVAVISYSSPNIQIIDANPLDTAINTVIATFTAPVTQSVTINGISCMICAAVVNPLNNQLILSTAQGFYAMNLTTGTFAALPFTPAPAPSANITIDPNALPDPFIVSAVPGSGEMQTLDLTTNAVTTYTGLSPAPTASAIDLSTQFTSVTDGTINEQTLVDFTNAQSPAFQSVPGIGICQGASYLNMTAMGVSPNGGSHTLMAGQTGGNCLGVQAWPVPGVLLSPFQVSYGYGPIPNTPDVPVPQPFVTGNDPNAIAIFNSVYDKNLYGVLVDANQQWIAKISFANFFSLAANIAPLPAGADASSAITSGIAGDTVIFLPTPSTTLTLSATNFNFGTISMGTPTPQFTVTLTNIGQSVLFPQIGLQGANPGDFSLSTNCVLSLQPLSNCAVSITFSPTATGARSAVLNVTSTGLPPQSVQLSGTGS